MDITRAGTRICAAGVQASPLARRLADQTGVPTDRAGRIEVNRDCTLPGHPEIFVIGDMALLDKLPAAAQPAMQEGKYVGKVIKRRLAGGSSVGPCKYSDRGSMATIGHKYAAAYAFHPPSPAYRPTCCGASWPWPTWSTGATVWAPCSPGLALVPPTKVTASRPLGMTEARYTFDNARANLAEGTRRSPATMPRKARVGTTERHVVASMPRPFLRPSPGRGR